MFFYSIVNSFVRKKVYLQTKQSEQTNKQTNKQTRKTPENNVTYSWNQVKNAACSSTQDS